MSNVAEHYFNQIAPQLQGRVGEAFQMQRNDVIAHIDNVIQSHGAQEAANMLSSLVPFSQGFDGQNGMPYLGDVFEAVHDLRVANITPNSAEFTQQIRHMADSRLIRAASVNDGETKVYDQSVEQNVERVWNRRPARSLAVFLCSFWAETV